MSSNSSNSSSAVLNLTFSFLFFFQIYIKWGTKFQFLGTFYKKNCSKSQRKFGNKNSRDFLFLFLSGQRISWQKVITVLWNWLPWDIHRVTLVALKSRQKVGRSFACRTGYSKVAPMVFPPSCTGLALARRFLASAHVPFHTISLSPSLP